MNALIEGLKARLHGMQAVLRIFWPARPVLKQ